MFNFLQSIFSKKERNDVVVSFTTIPSRIAVMEPCIKSLINQTIAPSSIVLWLCQDEYFGKNAISKDSVPEYVLDYEKKGLVTIKWTKNIGPFTKLIPALSEFPDKKIVTADDDTIYPRNWLKELINVSDKNPGVIVCHRGAEMLLSDDGSALDSYNSWPEFTSIVSGMNLFPTGKDGVLYPPSSFSNEVFNEATFKKLTPFNDDIWFKSMSLINDVSCIKVKAIHGDYKIIIGSDLVELQNQNVAQNMNDGYLSNVFDKYKLGKLLKND